MYDFVARNAVRVYKRALSRDGSSALCVSAVGFPGTRGHWPTKAIRWRRQECPSPLSRRDLIPVIEADADTIDGGERAWHKDFRIIRMRLRDVSIHAEFDEDVYFHMVGIISIK